MEKERQRYFRIAGGLLGAFVLWTVAISCVDVQPIGPHNSEVGFAELNRYVHDLTGVHMGLYGITDWLGLLPLGIVLGFGMLGMIQWIQRKHLLKVDRSILVLGGFYGVVLAAFAFFEIVKINYRPVLIEERLEASYPSSTTMLAMCVLPTAISQLRGRIKNRRIRQWVTVGMAVLAAFLVIGRVVSGVHWLTDIIGGILLSSGLVMLYFAVLRLEDV